MAWRAAQIPANVHFCDPRKEASATPTASRNTGGGAATGRRDADTTIPRLEPLRGRITRHLETGSTDHKDGTKNARAAF